MSNYQKKEPANIALPAFYTLNENNRLYCKSFVVPRLSLIFGCPVGSSVNIYNGDQFFCEAIIQKIEKKAVKDITNTEAVFMSGFNNEVLPIDDPGKMSDLSDFQKYIAQYLQNPTPDEVRETILVLYYFRKPEKNYQPKQNVM
jgi:hypothetical protein